MADWFPIAVADAVVAEINAQGFVAPIVVERVSGREYTLEELANAVGVVVPLDDQSEVGPGRDEERRECRIYVAVMEQSALTAKAAHDARANQLKTIRDHFRKLDTTVGGGVYVAGDIVSPVAENLAAGVYSGVLTMTFRGYDP